MKLLIGLVIIVIVMTSAAAERKQTMSKWMSEEHFFTSNLDEYCMVSTKEVLGKDENTLLELNEARAKFNESYDICIDETIDIRGYMAELFKIHEEKHNLTQIFCIQMELHHAVCGPTNIRETMKDCINGSKTYLDAAQLGPKCHDFANASLVEEHRKNKDFQPETAIISFECGSSDGIPKKWLQLKMLLVQILKQDFALLKDYGKKLKDELKCRIIRGSEEWELFSIQTSNEVKEFEVKFEKEMKNRVNKKPTRNKRKSKVKYEPNQGRMLHAVLNFLLGMIMFIKSMF